MLSIIMRQAAAGQLLHTLTPPVDEINPGSVLSLDNWYLTLPVGPSADPTNPIDIFQPQLNAYSDPYFFVDSDQWVNYRALAQGATTSSSSGSTRCELREMDGPAKSDKASWGFNDGSTHELTITLRADEPTMSVRKEVIVMQIHDETGTPPIYISINFDAINNPVKAFINGPSESTNLLDSYIPGGDITLRVRVSGGRCQLFAGVGTVSQLPTTPKFDYPASNFTNQTTNCYFKAGCYPKQKISDNGSGETIIRQSYLSLVNQAGSPPTAGGGATAVAYQSKYTDGSSYEEASEGTTIQRVTSSAQLTSALAAASAGQKIIVASGTYTGSFSLNGVVATKNNGLTIEAETAGGAAFGSGSTFTVKDSSHIVVRGLTFPNDESIFNVRGSSHHVRLTRNTIGPSTFTASDATSILYFYVADDTHHIRIDHNLLRNKGTGGNGVRVYGNFTTNQVAQYVRIDHNIFDTFGPEVSNDKEPVRYGVSSMSRSDAFGVVERNYITGSTGEPEIISVKANAVRVSGNSLYQNAGGLSIRHGRNSFMLDNYIIDGQNTTGSGGLQSGGIRCYDSGHTVSYNYIDGVIGSNYSASLLIDTGDASGSSTSLNSHWQIVNATFERNMVVNAKTGIQIGDNYSINPADCMVIDNITAAITGPAPLNYIASTTLTGNSMTTGNTNYSDPSAANMTKDADQIWRKNSYGPRLSLIKRSLVGPSTSTSEEI